MITLRTIVYGGMADFYRENRVRVVVWVDEEGLQVCQLNLDFDKEVGLVQAAFMF